MKKKLVIKDSFLTCTVSFQSQASNTQGRRPDHHFVKQTEKIIWHSLHRVLNIDRYHANLQLYSESLWDLICQTGTL